MPAQEQQPRSVESLQASLAEIQKSLTRSRRQLVEAQQLSRIGSWEWDIPANEVWWSPELYRIYGLEPYSLTPSYESFLGYVHPDDRASVDERNRRAFADHEPFEDVKRVIRADGREILMRTQGDVVCDAAGTPVRMVGVCEDVTERAAVADTGLSERAAQVKEEIVEPLAEAIAQIARGELEKAAATADAARRRASQLVEELLAAGPRAPAA
jgi:PAS domain S-box-containing protein